MCYFSHVGDVIYCDLLEKTGGCWLGQRRWMEGAGRGFFWITEMKTKDEAANDDVRALICRLHTHTFTDAQKLLSLLLISLSKPLWLSLCLLLSNQHPSCDSAVTHLEMRHHGSAAHMWQTDRHTHSCSKWHWPHARLHLCAAAAGVSAAAWSQNCRLFSF